MKFMKRIIYVVLAVWMMTAAGCSDFLDKNPPASLSEASFWKNKNDFDGAMTACYAAMRNANEWMASRAPYWDNLTDNSYGQHQEGQYGLTVAMVQGNITPVSGGFVESLYGGCYSAITRVNLFIEQLKKYQNPDISAAQKEMYQGEALFLRAFFHSYLYLTYGDVPVVTEPLNTETQFQPKQEAAKVAEQMHKDLDEAIRLLPDETYVKANGHLTKNAARAFKARMLLCDAYDAQGNAITATMTSALNLLKQVTGYSLSPEYLDLFQGPGQEGNPEIIFSVKYLAPNLYHASDRELGYWTCMSPLTNLVEEYEMEDGTPFSADDSRYDPEHPTARRDPRMDVSVNFGRFSHNGHTIPMTNPQPTGYQVCKFITRGDGSHLPGGEYSFRPESDWVHLRYADVLLMMAEAENGLNGPTQEVYDAIEQIRERAGLVPFALPDNLTKDQMREKIRHERRIETAFEGLRYFDLRRWKTVKTVMNSMAEHALPAYISKYEDRFARWPLPQTEIEKSKGVLVQNADYK
jgi:hypothetical protein